VTRRQDLQSLQQRRGILAAVGFRDPDDDVNGLRAQFVRRGQHRVSLAHTRRRAEENLQPAAAGAVSLSPDLGEQFVGILPGVRHRI